MDAVNKRRTHQKAATRTALSGSTDFISAQDLYARMREQGGSIGLATVYRNLNELVDAGEADTLQAGTGGQLFRFCGTDGHHHHLYCVECGRTIEVDAPIEAWVASTAAKHGFTEVRHVLDMFGVCPECKARSTTSTMV